jgi:paraquat-inducible protein A
LRLFTKHHVLGYLYYLCAIALAAAVVLNANAGAEQYRLLADHLSIDGRQETVLKNLLDDITLGVYRGGWEREEDIEILREHIDAYRYNANLSSWALAGLSVAYLLCVWFARRDSPSRMAWFVGHLLGVSLVCLYVGLFAPILGIVAYAEVPVLGQAIAKFESKGIIFTFLDLMRSGNVFIALLLMTFSVITPVTKVALCLLALAGVRQHRVSRYLAIVRAIGKWSMADVFVVAVLLAVFVMGVDKSTDSWLGHGLYFFAGYCVLSLVAGHLLIHDPSRNVQASDREH